LRYVSRQTDRQTDRQTERQTNKQTDMLIAILCTRTRGEVTRPTLSASEVLTISNSSASWDVQLWSAH